MSSNHEPFLRERVAALEVGSQALERRINLHDKAIDIMESKITELIYQVRQIKIALYVVAAALAANTPAAAMLVSLIK